jgi:tetratricopeptide (TPR) repeat protein
VDNALFGWRPQGWHWDNCLWHAANGVLVFLLARRLKCSPVAALLGGIWFAIHPVHAEAVVWISSRGSLLSTFGVVGILLFYAKWRDQPVWWAATGMLGAAFIGFFGKEDALMVFPVIGLYEFFIRGENPAGLIKQKTFVAAMIALGALAAIYLALRHSLIPGLSQGGREAGVTGWLATFPVILTTYLRQLIWPDPMCVDQPVDYGAGFGPAFWLSVVVLGGCAGFLVLRRGSLAYWQFALAFFLVTLVPVIGIIPINQPRADRFLYMPSVSGALAVGWVWDRVYRLPSWRPVYIAFLAASLAWYGWRSWDYSKTFLNETALWKNVLVINPQSYRGLANLAANANNDGQPQFALPLVEKALAVKPDYPEGLIIKAYALEGLGQATNAEACYRKAIETGGEDPRWLYLLADLLQREGKNAEAEKYYDRIAELRPGYVEARLAAGILALQMNEPAKGEAHLMAVLQADPSNQKAREILDVLHRQAPPAGK